MIFGSCRPRFILWSDTRRGEGIYDRLIRNMDELHRRDLIFGASVTVTTQNIREVTSDEFLKKLSDRGCKAVIYVEFVPVTDESPYSKEMFGKFAQAANLPNIFKSIRPAAGRGKPLPYGDDRAMRVSCRSPFCFRFETAHLFFFFQPCRRVV